MSMPLRSDALLPFVLQRVSMLEDTLAGTELDKELVFALLSVTADQSEVLEGIQEDQNSHWERMEEAYGEQEERIEELENQIKTADSRLTAEIIEQVDDLQSLTRLNDKLVEAHNAKVAEIDNLGNILHRRVVPQMQDMRRRLKNSESRYKKQNDKYKKLKAANLLMANEIDKLTATVTKLEASSSASASSSSAQTSRDSALMLFMMSKMEEHHGLLEDIKIQAALQRNTAATDATNQWAQFMRGCVEEFREWKDANETDVNMFQMLHLLRSEYQIQMQDVHSHIANVSRIIPGLVRDQLQQQQMNA